METIATTVGRPRPGFELRIVDERAATWRRARPVRCCCGAAASWPATSTTPRRPRSVLSPDGWLRTGDLGVIDDAGCLRIVGRVKDMFIVGGFNAYPAEIENALLRHPDIQQAAVIGIPDERLGEVGMAFVVRGRGPAPPADIIEWSRGTRWPTTRCPRVVEIVDELPLNATGKVMKDVLRQQAGARPGRGGRHERRRHAGPHRPWPACGWSSWACGWRHRRRRRCWPTGAPT